MFTRPVFTGAVAANLLSVFSLVGFLYFVSQHLQLVSSHSPMDAGLLLLPGLVVTVISGLLVVRVVRHTTPATAVVAGLCLNAAGFVQFIISGSWGGDLTLLMAFAVLGAGVGAAETISNDLILSAVPAERAVAAELPARTGEALLDSARNAFDSGAGLMVIATLIAHRTLRR